MAPTVKDPDSVNLEGPPTPRGTTVPRVPRVGEVPRQKGQKAL
jgi:hypothetical protein